MADAAARREARRKKILQNSHNRLQLISGKSVDDLPKGPIYPIRSSLLEENLDNPDSTESIFASKPPLSNGILVGEPEPFECLLSNRSIDAGGDSEVLSDIAGFTHAAVEPQQPTSISLWTKLVTYKYDLVLLSFTLQVLYSFSVVDFDNLYFFLPLAIYVSMKAMWTPVKPQSSLANAFLMLSGISPERAQVMMNVGLTIAGFSQDIFVYLFATICIQSLQLALKDVLLT